MGRTELQSDCFRFAHLGANLPDFTVGFVAEQNAHAIRRNRIRTAHMRLLHRTPIDHRLPTVHQR